MVLATAHISSACAEDAERWHAPFGGTFNANFTVTSDYSYAGVSASGRGPAVQAGLDYRTPNLIERFPVWIYLSGWGSNTTLIAGQGVEIDTTAGVKALVLDRKVKLDLGYLRVSYPGFSDTLGYNYGAVVLNIDYDIDWATLNGRVLYSPNSFGNGGQTWNKRGMLSVPLPFLNVDGRFIFKGYVSLGNYQVQNPLPYGISVNDYWYWQIGFVTSAFGPDMMIAYTGTNLGYAACNNTNYCDSRVFVSVTKVF
ncbi:conserved hypothetical protein [Enhydrobacter aerosaccus]|uniref:MetA-pathway of phenol degradation n=1 Tax=Enhydrobacter aerosaccus TaxID=225324 RepID=A0A1T4T1G2_9HYPH|nr:TorF family putative porin [Enhydrobacter aerosaccus]SKA34081.1 conserved hypothetical protein [Enhydrobacter aerosaccus]